jgi:hypothetical protein
MYILCPIFRAEEESKRWEAYLIYIDNIVIDGLLQVIEILNICGQVCRASPGKDKNILFLRGSVIRSLKFFATGRQQ